MKLNIALYSLFLFSCTSNKITVTPKNYDKAIDFQISIDSIYNISVQLVPRFDTGAIIISNPSSYPITSLDLYDKYDRIISQPKVKSSLDLKKAIIKLSSNKTFTATYLDLKRWVPNDFKDIKKIRATYFYNAFINGRQFLVDSLILK
jgi:hypothetical protein